MAANDYDLFIIGAGSGGVRAARIAARHGARVAVAEEYRPGGTCVIRGCVPKKLLVYASRFADDFEDSIGFGWSTSEVSFDWATLIANKDREIARLEAVYKRTLEAAGVQLFASRAVLRDRHTAVLEVDGREVTARYILIATGAMPVRSGAIAGVEHAITSNEAFNLSALPERIVIFGGGYIAVEFAGIFNGLGSATTLVYRGPEILRGFDDDLRRGVREAMTRRGVEVICGAALTAIEGTPGNLRTRLSTGETIETDQVMLAMGRRPNTHGLGLEAAGVDLDALGAVVVDRFSQSSIDNVFAVGDVTNRLNLTPVAIREGHAFADSVFGGKPTAVDHINVPTAVFSQPEIGTVGLTEARARELCRKVAIYKTSFRGMRNTLGGRDERMMMKLVVDGESGRVVGCHILGPEASEMAQILAIALRAGATKADFDATVAIHPTAAEELVTLAEPWEGD
ncbi:MAG TPA: glutathione-disulfide reductase [Aestuariivirgaceae bacterium]|jgi:glutathione reductase (NADPH)|nr:glutathione-disulfide reductase [Aestuariivirgaceae bacterium]